MQDQSSQSSGQLHLFFRHVETMPNDVERSLLENFSESERTRLDAIKSPGRRLEYLVSRDLMRDALSGLFDRDPASWIFEERRGESPLVTNLPPGHNINLSHSKGLICFAVADSPMGIDIEARQHQRDYSRLAKMFMTEDERRALVDIADPGAFFYRCWCIKEAFYKAHPKTQQEHLHFTGISVTELEQDSVWHLLEGQVDEHYLVAATRDRVPQIHCHYYPGETSWAKPFSRNPRA